MTYRVRIEEIKGDKLVKLFDENIDKGIMKMGDTVGMIGYGDSMEVMLDVEEFVQNLAVKMTGLGEEDEPDWKLMLATAITECVIGINIAAMAIGPISDSGLIEDEEKCSKLKQQAFSLLDKGREIASISDVVEVMTPGDCRQKLGELLMEELDSLNKGKD